MAVKIYLGKPPAHVENWIKNHSEPNLKHTFGVISDIHQILNYYDETNDSMNPFVTALNVFKSKNITDISICGDITDNGAGGDFDAFVGAYARNYIAAKIESCTGNHDCDGDFIGIDDLWRMTFNHGINFTELKNDKLFIYFSFGAGNGFATSSAPYSSEDLVWLRTLLTETYPTKFAFIFMHFPFNSIYSENNKLVGIKADQDYGFGNQDGQCYQLFEMLRNRGNCMVFSGHTHYELGVQDTISNYANMDSFGNNMYCVHVPSLTKPRNDQHVNITSNPPRQGYIVDYTDDTVEIKAIDFLTNSIIDKYGKTFNIGKLTGMNITVKWLLDNKLIMDQGVESIPLIDGYGNTHLFRLDMNEMTLTSNGSNIIFIGDGYKIGVAGAAGALTVIGGVTEAQITGIITPDGRKFGAVDENTPGCGDIPGCGDTPGCGY